MYTYEKNNNRMPHAELSMIVTELGLQHIIRSDNGLCYNSKEFQQFLQ